jgi:hypothetical protein
MDNGNLFAEYGLIRDRIASRLPCAGTTCWYDWYCHAAISQYGWASLGKVLQNLDGRFRFCKTSSEKDFLGRR